MKILRNQALTCNLHVLLVPKHKKTKNNRYAPSGKKGFAKNNGRGKATTKGVHVSITAAQKSKADWPGRHILAIRSQAMFVSQIVSDMQNMGMYNNRIYMMFFISIYVYLLLHMQ